MNISEELKITESEIGILKRVQEYVVDLAIKHHELSEEQLIRLMTFQQTIESMQKIITNKREAFVLESKKTHILTAVKKIEAQKTYLEMIHALIKIAITKKQITQEVIDQLNKSIEDFVASTQGLQIIVKQLKAA